MGQASEFAAHLIEVHDVRLSQAFFEAHDAIAAGRASCARCEAWLSRQLEELRKEDA
jgi:hypothetical protein